MTYVDDRFYADIVKAFTDWQRPELEVTEVAVRDQCRALLEREARLLDDGRFEEWLNLYSEHCVLWVPAAERAGDPPGRLGLGIRTALAEGSPNFQAGRPEYLLRTA